jgi:hypothetical protein
VYGGRNIFCVSVMAPEKFGNRWYSEAEDNMKVWEYGYAGGGKSL